MTSIVIGTNASAGPVSVDIERLIDTRLLITANSGAGKSYAARKILEGSYASCQHHILDPEDEFHTLRDAFDYIVAGRPGGAAGDCPADPSSAAVLARRVMELGVSIVLSLSHLDWPGRQLFAKNYIDALMAAPRSLWRPALVVIDESHKFASERGEDDKVKAVSSDSVVALMSQGRKRGLGGVLVVQRLSRLRKSAAADANNVLIGRTGLDVDVKRAAAILGYDRDKALALRKLPDGYFHAYGPAISDEVVGVQIGEVITRHPKAGDVPPAPRAARAARADAHALASARAKLADVTEVAVADARTVENLTVKVADLERQLRTKPRPLVLDASARPADPSATEHAVQAAEARLLMAYRQKIDHALAAAERGAVTAIRAARMDALVETAPLERSPLERMLMETLPPVVTPADRDIAIRGITERNGRAVPTSDGHDRAKLTGPELRLLDAIAWWESIGVSDVGVSAHAFVAGYSPSSSSFTNARGSLRAKGLVEYGIAATSLTDAGRAIADAGDMPRTNDAMQARVMERLDGPCRSVLGVLLRAYPDSLSKEGVAGAAGYAASSSSFTNACGRLRSLGLADYPRPGWIAAADLLFPEAA